MTALEEHAVTIPAPPPDGCHDDEHGDDHAVVLPPPPAEIESA